MSDFETLAECDDCGAVAEWNYCAEHKEADFTCYEMACVACDWRAKDCETTEHLTAIK